jgi:F-type H+-transporting ATPase subunit h
MDRMTDNADLVQDLYINQLKAYKPAPQVRPPIYPLTAPLPHHPNPPSIRQQSTQSQANIQTADASSSVRSYKAPSSPKAPTLPTDLASELSKFDAEEPSFASPAAAKKSSATDGAESADEYLTFLEKDLPKADAHH